MVISVPDMNDSFSRIVLDGKEILLRFTYCVNSGYWLFGVYTHDEKPIVASIRNRAECPHRHSFVSVPEIEGRIGDDLH